MSKKNDDRRLNILKDIIDKTVNTQETIMAKYGISIRTLKEDIKTLRNQGYSIKSSKGTYIMQGDDAEKSSESISFYQSIDKTYIRKLLILLIMQQEDRSLSEAEIENRYYDYAGIDPKAIGEDTDKAVTRATLSVAIAGLLEEKLIVVDAKSSTTDTKMYKVSSNAPVYLQLDEDQALDIIETIGLHGASYPFAKELKAVAKKIAMAMGEDEESVEYKVVGRNYKRADKVEQFMDMLSAYDYENRQLVVSYKNSKKQEYDVTIAVGMIVYAADKDKLYLVGKTVDKSIESQSVEPSYKDVVLQSEHIISISESGEANEHYQSTYYKDMFEQMFSISTDEPVHVKVEFRNIFNISNKIETLAETRLFSKLVYTDDVITYEDDVRGLADFAGYLRKYGKSAKVIEPAELRNMMIYSANRLLERYEEVASDEQ